MAMTRGFKLFHTLFLVFTWQYCAKVGATFSDITGFFDFGSFGSGGVGILRDLKGANTLKLAPGIAPSGFESPMNEIDYASSLGFKFSKEIHGEIGVSNDDVIDLKSVGHIDVSNGGIISRKIIGGIVSNDGKVGLRS